MSALAGLARRIRARDWLQRQARTTASGQAACAPARTRSARPTCRPPAISSAPNHTSRPSSTPAALAETAGATELRLSPWRTVYFGARDAAAAAQAVDAARFLGLIVDSLDPLLRIEACPGAPDCKSSSVDARGDARRLAALASAEGYDGSIHVSGCAKGCARSTPAKLVLVGKAGRYRLVRNATTRGPVERIIGSDEFPALFAGSRDG